MGYRLGIDIGGTFTDFAMVNDDDGDLTLEKLLTTPADPSIAVLEGFRKLLDDKGIQASQVHSVIHGSTLVTNAVIERKGAAAAALITEGFSDVFDIALERRYDLYDLRLRLPDPIIPRSLRAEVSERMREDGSAIRPPDLNEVEREVSALIDCYGIRALAVCFLHSFTNPEHEQTVANFVRRRFPQLYVSASSEVLPFMREYERWNTTAINTFVGPLVDAYLSRIEAGLAKLGFSGLFHIVTSSAGAVTAQVARQFPVRMLESGPAAGVLMAAHIGRRIGMPSLLSFDMGGTTAKGSIVRNGRPHKKYEIEVARVHEFKTGSGLPVKIPVVDMIEIGAGGGGIAELDDRGLLRVGPRSAGADPGPACYGRGGKQATLTDANLSLGYYDSKSFLGGRMALDKAAGEDAIARGIGKPLNLTLERAAWGIHETINEDVARAFRVHASEIGFDYRRCSMLAFGGSGPAHAMRIARKLRIPKVVFPIGVGVMSAIGMLVSPLSFQVARTNRVFLDQINSEQFGKFFGSLQEEVSKVLLEAGLSEASTTVHRSLDMRYEGQGFEIEVPLPDAKDVTELFAQLPQLYADAYKEIFSLSFIDEPIEILNWKIEAIGPLPRIRDRCLSKGSQTSPEPRGRRRAYFPESGFIDCPVYDRYTFEPGFTVQGPALIEERESTCVLGHNDRARLDNYGNLIAEPGTLA
ncbi:MAG TPA: hydantoinase/oxoprolinase family protein [Pseudolabrys sp.]|nr:hydantoinase/oxoprolinase family protein [Pseudolabrys sp.]